jgi:predicted nucleic acid-binding protein
VVDEVFPVERADVERARQIVLGTRLSARDAVHLAIMRRRGIDRILTFDRAFDGIDGITRIGG